MALAEPARAARFRRESAPNSQTQTSHDYALVDGDGNVIETGSVARLQPKAVPHSTIDLQPYDGNGQPSGQLRLGVYDIVSATIRIDWGAPGASRPSNLSNASVYTTR